MALTARNIRWILLGLVLTGALLLPLGTASVLEALPTRAVMIAAVIASFGAFQLVAFQWSALPSLVILLFGSSVTQLFGEQVPPLLWWFTGLACWALSAPEVLDVAIRRLKPLAQHNASLDDVPRARLIRFHLPVWTIAVAIMGCYTVLLPVMEQSRPPQELLMVALFGAVTGCAVALLTGKWRLYTVFLVSAVVAISFLERADYVTFLGMSWTAGYLVACVLKDPTTLHRSLPEVRKASKIQSATEY